MFKGLRSQASAWRPLRPGARWFNPIRFESTPSSPSNLSCSFELKVSSGFARVPSHLLSLPASHAFLWSSSLFFFMKHPLELLLARVWIQLRMFCTASSENVFASASRWRLAGGKLASSLRALEVSLPHLTACLWCVSTGSLCRSICR